MINLKNSINVIGICGFIFISILLLSLISYAQDPDFGVTKYIPEKTDLCYRLFSSRNLQAAHLIAPNGRYVHSWYYNSDQDKEGNPKAFGMSWHYAEMLANGNLLAIIKDDRIIELDWNSNLVWEAKLRAHHDFARDEKGNTIVVSRRDISDPWRDNSIISMDQLIEFDSKGEKIWTWNFEEHSDEVEQFVNQPLPPHKSFKDWPHINTCEILPDNPSAKTDKRFKKGNLLLNGRHSNTVMVVDKSSGKVVWAWGPGILEGPHMPTMLPNGNILVYDNGKHIAETARKYTRILELNPITEEIVWEYGSNGEFYSPSRGSNNRLENGNTLIADSDNGRLFEVSGDGELVWEFLNTDVTGDRRMALYRTVPYSKELVDGLLDEYGKVPDVLPRETLKFRKFEGEKYIQYKQMIREVVFYLETGYYEHAMKFVNDFNSHYPDDEEGYWAYSLIYAARKDVKKSFEYMKKALDKGLPVSRFAVGLSPIFDPLTKSEMFLEYISQYDIMNVHGPLLGNVTADGASFWVRTYKPARVQVVAVKKDNESSVYRSAEFHSKGNKENTAVVRIEGLSPDTDYSYYLKINDRDYKNESYYFSTAPAKGEAKAFNLVFGGGAGYTPKHERMWDTLQTYQPELFLSLGDNVYVDHPERPLVQKYCYYRRLSRPEYKRFTSGTALYAIYDDHDFTYNDGWGGPDKYKPYWKKNVLEIFRNNFVNPYYGGGEENPGCWFDFSYGDVDFFMLDCRYYREDPKNRDASMLGQYQKNWLLEKLNSSTATFKVIASSVPWAKNTKPGSKDTWDGYNNEREDIFKFIEDNKIEGVILISADRHRSDAWRIERPEAYNLYDFMSSKLTNIHTHNIMPGSLFGYNKKCSAGILSFDTTKEDPTVTYKIINIDNEEIFRITLFLSDLSFRK